MELNLIKVNHALVDIFEEVTKLESSPYIGDLLFEHRDCTAYSVSNKHLKEKFGHNYSKSCTNRHIQ